MKKALKLALIPAAIFVLFITGTVCSASGEFETVLFEDWHFDMPDYAELSVKGKISLGESTVPVDDGCLEFTAENAGYYGYNYPNKDTKTLMDVAKPSGGGKADIIYTEFGTGLNFDWVENSDTGYYVFYLESPGTYYLRFSTDEYDNENPDPSSDTIVLTYLGDLVSCETVSDPLYIETDACLIWKEEVGGLCSVKMYLEFTNGRYNSSVIGDMDKWESGKSVFTFNLGNGPEIRKNVTLIGMADSVESVSFPDNFRPAVSKRYEAIDASAPYSGDDEKNLFPEWIDLKFKDGSSVRAVPDKTTYGLSEILAFFEDGEGHSHWVLCQYLYYDTGVVFIVNIDGIIFSETKAETEYNIISDYSNHISNYIYYLKYFARDILNSSPLEAISSLFNNLRIEKNNFSEYIKGLK